MRPGALILQALDATLAMTGNPLAGRLDADMKQMRCLIETYALLDELKCQLLSHFRRQSGILMDVHPLSSVSLSLRKLSFSDSEWMDNLLRFHN